VDLSGRGAELGSLAAALDEATAGTGRLVGLVGEPGIGKTRLAEEVARLADERGFVTLMGRTPPREMGVAYGPIVEALTDHLRSLDIVARAATTNGLPELAALLGSLVPGRAEPLADVELEQARLFEAVARLLERIQEDAPVLLFVDDAHEADTASLALLHYLCRRLDRQRVVTLLTYRSDADSLRPLRELHTTMRRQGRLQEVALEPLRRDDLADLVARRLEGPPSDALLDLLEVRAGGVPLFAETLLAGLRDSGELSWIGGSWSLALDADPDVPPVARDVILRPLDRLASADRDLSDLLAVAGEAVAHALLARLAGADGDELTAGIDRLRAAGLVDEVMAAGRVAYRLHHPLIAEVAYAELGEASRRRLHAAFVASLEDEETVDVQRLARHYRGAASEVDTDRAREVLAAAGEQALSMHANREAVAHLSAALELHRADGRTEGVGIVLEQLGDALERIGEHAAAVGVWEEALAAATSVEDVLGAGRLHRRLAEAEWQRGRLAEMRAHLRAGRSVLADRPPTRELAQLHLTEVWLLTWLQDFTAAEHAVAALADLAVRLDSPTATVEALLAEARFRLARLQPEAAVACAERALVAAEEAGDPLLLWHAHNVSIICEVWDGGHRVIREHASASLVLARRLAVPALELRSCAMMAVADFFSGDWASAFTWISTVLERAPLVGQPRPAVHSVASVAVLASHGGEDREVARALSEVVEEYGRLEHDIAVQMLLVPAEMQIALAQDRVDDAVGLADDTLPRIHGFGGWLLLTSGQAYVRAGRFEDALALVPRIPEMAASPRSFMAAEARRIEGLARSGLGSSEQALVCLADSHDMYTDLEAPFFAARARLDWGRIRGGREGAAAVRESLEVFERIGAHLYVEEARQALRELGETPPRRRRTGPGELSPREREVACLAAEGLTSAQIAERLVISPHTARTHLKRIHERLGVSSRAELTRHVIDAGWLTDTPS
jgi:DNA-binding CsgD family transcriptional regulator